MIEAISYDVLIDGSEIPQARAVETKNVVHLLDTHAQSPTEFKINRTGDDTVIIKITNSGSDKKQAPVDHALYIIKGSVAEIKNVQDRIKNEEVKKILEKATRAG